MQRLAIGFRVMLVAVAALAVSDGFAQSGTFGRGRMSIAGRPDWSSIAPSSSPMRATGAPLTGVSVTVGADMPSMPMMHNVKPVKAVAGAEPGTYHSRIELEMSGAWAVKIDLAGPVRDRVIKSIRVE